jgi:hypothetical protein
VEKAPSKGAAVADAVQENNHGQIALKFARNINLIIVILCANLNGAVLYVAL